MPEPRGLYRYTRYERVPQPEKAEKEMAWKKAEDRIISGVHTSVEEEFGRAKAHVTLFCRTEVGRLAKRFHITDNDLIADLANACDNEARKWAKADVQEWMKTS